MGEEGTFSIDDDGYSNSCCVDNGCDSVADRIEGESAFGPRDVWREEHLGVVCEA